MGRGPAPRTDEGVGHAAWSHSALETLAGVPDVRRAGLALVEGGGRRLRFTATDRPVSEAGPEWCHIDAYDDVPLNWAVRRGEAVVGSLADLDPRYGAFVERQRGTTTVAIAAVPITAVGQILGAYVLFFDDRQPFDAAQRDRLQTLGGRLGAALRQSQSTQDRVRLAFSDDAPPGASYAVHEVPGDPAAVRGARRFLRETLSAWGVDEDIADTAVLCLSELVTNAVVHTHSGCGLRVQLDRGVLTVSVRDSGGRERRSADSAEDPLQVHGRGLDIVECLATRWGSTLHADGTTVWFVLNAD